MLYFVQPLPKSPSPVFCLAMRGLLVSCSSIEKKERVSFYQYEYRYDLYFSERNISTHLRLHLGFTHTVQIRIFPEYLVAIF